MRYFKALNKFPRVLAFVGVAAVAVVVASLAVSEPTPKTDSGNIGIIVGKMLEQGHYMKRPVNDAVSRQFLDLYLESPAMDFAHITFFQSDIDEFRGKYSDKLDDALNRGDVQPAFEIFNRYLKRLEQRLTYMKSVLNEQVDFTEDESVLTDRREAAWPADEAAAKKLWRQWAKFDLLQEKLNKDKPEETAKTLGKRYDRVLRIAREIDGEQVVESYLTALGHVFDPHTDYLSPSDLENFAIQMRLSLVGIGAVLQDDDGYAKIVSVVPGGPAGLDKRLKANDRIVGVGQGEDGTIVDVVGLPLQKVVEQIRGKKGSTVRLQVSPADAPDTRTEIKLVRDEIKLTESEAKGKVIEMQDVHGKTHKLGYIDLPSFYADMQATADSKSTTRDVKRLIEHLKTKNIEGLILDLRRNGGGSLNEAINLTGLFIKEGPVVEVKDFAGNIQVHKDTDSNVTYNGPLVVLTSHQSASASEIVAGALQDYARAVIVGEKSTFGKGTVQSMIQVGQQVRLQNGQQPNWGALKLTIQKFYRVSGGSTQNKGVIPDIQLPSTMDYRKVAESALKNAMPYDEVPKANFESASAATPSVIALVRTLSEKRVSSDAEFKYVQEDIAKLKEQLESKMVSLNEAKRLAEKAADTARDEARKKEREERAKKNTSPYKMTDVTLAQLDGKADPAPAITKSILQAAAKASGDKTPTEPEVDPVFEEGLRILSDFVRLSQTALR